jgi:hypothetical protein
MAVRTTLATLLTAGTLLAGTVLGLGGAASAADAPARADRAAVSAPSALTADQDRAAARLSCAYGSVCGQGANGHSFSYRKCGTRYQLPDLTGTGPLNNNQTAGTVAKFYGRSGNLLFTSRAPEQRSVDWTPVWYAVAC